MEELEASALIEVDSHKELTAYLLSASCAAWCLVGTPMADWSQGGGQKNNDSKDPIRRSETFGGTSPGLWKPGPAPGAKPGSGPKK